ncbi:phosphatidate phosphatase LPIN2 isoform X2 [Gouania willdenowi]|uniref:phosphatidate phosphatase n=1 Tax=Gouania willdenowi TaxID=441366 RepID=A0A8C5GNC6_GOUWI|nr:phosphatidate phosphatase LPIN2-like isoform X2 [Gouania willdenowi]
MNIVGHLAETVFVTVKELYRGLNPATLTGGIDVVVVRQPDGSFQCSPFHVRFGKLGVLRSKEKIVDIEINGESVDLHMKLGDNGEAFFVEYDESWEVPAHLCTSPIPCEAPEDLEKSTEAPFVSGSAGARRKKRRRKRIRSDTHLREQACSSSDENEMCEHENDQPLQESPSPKETRTPLQVSKSVYYSLTEEPNDELGATQTRESHPHSDGEQSPSEKKHIFFSHPHSPKSDSELEVKSHDSSGPQMQWHWGDFPMLCQPECMTSEEQNICPSGTCHFRTIERQDCIDMDSYQDVFISGKVGRVTVVKPLPRTQSVDLGSLAMLTAINERPSNISHCTPNELFKSCEFPKNTDSEQMLESKLENELTKDLSAISISDAANAFNSKEDTEGNVSVDCSPINISVTKINDAQESVPIKVCTVLELSEQSEQESNCALGSEGDSGIDPWAGEEDNQTIKNNKPKDDGINTGENIGTAEGSTSNTESSSVVEQQGKKKGKRNHHLGPTDIYLDDLTSLDPEVASLYFPKSETEAAFQLGTDQGQGSGSQSPQSVGSGAMDSGTEYLSDSASYNMDISMSLCGKEGDTSQITKEKFLEHLVTFQDFVNNVGIIEDPSLVICINSNYYNWAVAAPMVLSMTTFQKNLPQSTVERLVKDKMPKKSGRWWFSWRRRHMDNSQKSSKEEQEEPVENVSSPVIDEAAGLSQKAVITSSLSIESATQSINQMYRKSLRLTSNQIEHLRLREGANKVVFSVTTQYQGTCRAEAAIYLWNWNDRVIISDIDGTITKSDALGHILPQFGKDWTHKGIAKLYHKIHQNGYKFLYCSARAIGMAAITKNYLHWVNDRGTVLPKGPVLLAPSSFFSALHREVIEKKPEVFKVACLGDIRDLFKPLRQPFYGAFGNRINDAFAYKQVGVPETKIFTVNPKGELIQEKTKGNKSSYSHLSEVVEHFFPELNAGGSTSSVLHLSEFSSFSYWKEPLPQLDLDALL